jgi:acetolactate synthase-1/2/3 large subunit
MLILANKACRTAPLELAGKVAAGTGCRLASQFFTNRIERGAGRVPLERIPYSVAPALRFLEGTRHIVTLETKEPVAFFSYPGQPSLLKEPGTQVHSLSEADEDSTLALEMLVEALGLGNAQAVHQQPVERVAAQGALDPTSIAHALGMGIPDNAIVVDESLTSGRESMSLTLGAAPHDMINNLGGSIGYSPPVATGAAIACPDRRTICLVGDGSAMYTIQALWSQARESLPVTTVVFANNTYNILKAEYSNMGAGDRPSAAALRMIDIDRPTIDWLAMGRSMGVPGVQVETAEDLARQLVAANGEPGPRLIEVKLY